MCRGGSGGGGDGDGGGNSFNGGTNALPANRVEKLLAHIACWAFFFNSWRHVETGAEISKVDTAK